MDLIAAKLGASMAIDELAANGQIGSGEPGKTYAWDGILEGKDYVPYMDGAGFIKVSSDTPDLRKFEKIETVNGTFMADGDEHYFADGTAENGELFGAKGTALIQKGTTNPFAVVITDTLNSPIPSTGLYFVCMDFGTGIEALTYELVIAGTIKTIDPKYLPSGGNTGGGGGGNSGGELPVIDLIALGVNSVPLADFANEKIVVSPEVKAELISKLSPLTPVIVKFLADDAPMEVVANPVAYTIEEGYTVYWVSTVQYVISTPMIYSLNLDTVNNDINVENQFLLT